MYKEKVLSKTVISINDAILHWRSLAFKRVVDIAASLLGMFFLLPVFVLIAIAIKQDTPGPVFYRGKRMGRGGKEFQILKFRTMYETAESYSGPKVTASDDIRITPLGHWLRNTKLNELPQLWNVLKGEMSLVGPRPEDPDIACSWPQKVFQEVLSVRPGITSPASVVYRNEEALLCAENLLKKYLQDVSPDKMRLDQLYVRYRSFLLDMDILFWTFLILIPRLRTFSPPETLLFVGPVTRIIRRYVDWFFIDLFITVFAFSFMGIIWHSYSPLNLGWANAIGLDVGFALLFSITEALMGVNRVSWSKATFADLYDLIIAWLTSTIIVILFTMLVPGFPMSLVIGASLLAVFGFVVVRYRSRLMVELINWILRSQNGRQAMCERVLIIGSNQAGQHAAWLLTHPVNALKFYVVGFVDNDFLRQDLRLYGARVLGTIKDVPALMKKHRVSLVMLANYKEFTNEFASISLACAESAAKLVVLPDILATLGGLATHIGSVEKSKVQEMTILASPVPGSVTFIPQTGALGLAARDCEQNPCMHCLIHNDTYQLGFHLGELNEKIEAGDLEGLRACINAMKESIQQ